MAGMSGTPAGYTGAVIANSSIEALINKDVNQPLDALTVEYGQNIPAGQKITVDNKVMAIAFMANAQTLA